MATIDREGTGEKVGILNGITATSRDFFFDGNAGVNSSSVGTGTPTSPWLNNQNVNGYTHTLSSYQPGDRFLQRSGVICGSGYNYFDIPMEGTEDAHIVFGAWEGNIAFLNYMQYTSSPSINPIVVNNARTPRTLALSSAYTTPVYFIAGTGIQKIWEDGISLNIAENITDLLDSGSDAGGTYDGTYNAWKGPLDVADDAGTPDGIYWRPTSGIAKASEVIWLADGIREGTGNLYNITNLGGDTPLYVDFENFDSKWTGGVVRISSSTKAHRNITVTNVNCSHGTGIAMNFIGGSGAGGSGIQGCKDITVDSCKITYYPAGIQFDAYNSLGYQMHTCIVKNCEVGYMNYLNPTAGVFDSEAIGVQSAQYCQFIDNYLHDIGMPEGYTLNTLGNSAISFWNPGAGALAPHCIPRHNLVARNLIMRSQSGIVGLHNGDYTEDSVSNLVVSNILIGMRELGIKIYAQGSTNLFANNLLADCEVGMWLGKNTGAGGSTVRRNMILSPRVHYASTQSGTTVDHSVDYNYLYGVASDATAFGSSVTGSAPYTGTAISLSDWLLLTSSPDANSKITNPFLASSNPKTAAQCYPRTGSTALTDGDEIPTYTDYFGNTPTSAYIGSVSTMLASTTANVLKINKPFEFRR